jgi:hypothetical protein
MTVPDDEPYRHTLEFNNSMSEEIQAEGLTEEPVSERNGLVERIVLAQSVHSTEPMGPWTQSEGLLTLGGIDQNSLSSEVVVSSSSGEVIGDLKLVTLNCKHLERNWPYVRSLQEKTDIIFLQETWLHQGEEVSGLDTVNFNIYSKSSMTNELNAGRPHGGVMWLINKKIQTKKVTFLTNRISTLEMSKTVIIGVYLRFNDQTDSETLIEHGNDVERIRELVNKASGKRAVVVGDFNSDLNRKKNFDKILQKMIVETPLIALDHIYLQSSDYTFEGRGKSWIDHVLGDSLFADCVSQVNILNGEEDQINSSDHLAIMVEFKQDQPLKSRDHPKCEKKGKVDWNSVYQCAEYEYNAAKCLSAVRIDQVLNAEKHNVVEKLDELINNVYSSLRNAFEITKKKGTKVKHKKQKKWWDDELTYIKQQINLAYMRYKETNFLSEECKRELKTIKRLFRRKLREKKKLNQKGFQRKLEILKRKSNKEFWEELNKKKKKRVSVEVETDKLKSSFEDLFNKKIVENENDEHLTNIKKEVDEHAALIGDEKIEFEINSAEFEMIIKTLKNNKSVGFAEISNEMVKYGGLHLTYILKLIIEKIIQFGKVPHFFNVGKIIPIIKDDCLATDDPNNIRPITISDTLANIFEKVALLEIEKTHKEHNLQFGFKKNSSCNHAVFVVKETVNYYGYKNNGVHACAIDASKAFDKINRLALMHKLIG